MNTLSVLMDWLDLVGLSDGKYSRYPRPINANSWAPSPIFLLQQSGVRELNRSAGRLPGWCCTTRSSRPTIWLRKTGLVTVYAASVFASVKQPHTFSVSVTIQRQLGIDLRRGLAFLITVSWVCLGDLCSGSSTSAGLERKK
jgi:hypothetical protein